MIHQNFTHPKFPTYGILLQQEHVISELKEYASGFSVSESKPAARFSVSESKPAAGYIVTLSLHNK